MAEAMTEERLAELDGWPKGPAWTDGRVIRELVAEVRRARDALKAVDLNMQEELRSLRLRSDARIAELDAELVAVRATVDRARDQLQAGEATDGYHTHNELYEFRLLYHADAVRAWITDAYPVVKSWRHSDGEQCFGGGWFIVSAELPSGQVTNHYRAEDWRLFDIPEVATAPEWDGHDSAAVAARLRRTLDGGDR